MNPHAQRIQGGVRGCRDAFVAPEGRVLLSADYAQMELRLMAHLSGDESLRAVLADPDQDPFTQWAAQWLRVKPITAVCAPCLASPLGFTHNQTVWVSGQRVLSSTA